MKAQAVDQGAASDSAYKSKWRADIEGLRALAIVGVVADHAGLPFVQGGFVGVDIFFVLSGYLISSLLLQELRTSGSINFVAFYARRLRRLLPGLVLMLLFGSIIGAAVLAPYEQIPQAQAAGSAFLWLSNFHFSIADFGYFDLGSESNLYLHTWSLGVEEQFYLLWPLLLLYLLTGTPGSPDTKQARLRMGLALVLLASFVLCILLTTNAPLWAFYAMPSRCWQFALGALVYLHVNSARQQAAGEGISGGFSQPVQLWAGWAGAILILGSAFFMHERMSYPGGWAVLPSAGAALVIFAGSGAVMTQSGFSQLLAAAPMRFIGKVSYSWYLWHWPVLVLGSVLRPEGDIAYQLFLMALSLLLATVAYFLVEKPVRNSEWLRNRHRVTLAGALVLMAGGVLLGQSWKTAATAWTEHPTQVAYQALRSDLPQLYSLGCDEWFSSSRVKVCSFGESAAANTAVLFGDSVGLQWFSAIAPYYAQSGWRVLVVTKSSCPLVDESWFYPRIGAEYVVCDQWRHAAVNFLVELKPALIFMGSAATYDYSSVQWRDGSARILAPLSAAAGKIYVIRGTPRLPFDGPGCLARQDWQPEFIARLSDCAAPVPVVPDAEVLVALQAATAQFANVRLLDFTSLLCPDGYCRARIRDSIVFRDPQHVTNRYVEALRQEVLNAITAAE